VQTSLHVYKVELDLNSTSYMVSESILIDPIELVYPIVRPLSDQF